MDEDFLRAHSVLLAAYLSDLDRAVRRGDAKGYCEAMAKLNRLSDDFGIQMIASQYQEPYDSRTAEGHAKTSAG